MLQVPDQVTSNWAVVDYSSLAALVFILAEYIMTIESEYEHIWRWRVPLWSPKGLYFLARYVGVITQIVHYSLIHIYLNRGPVQPQHCRAWFFFLTYSYCALLAVFDMVLLFRVYDFYGKNINIYILIGPLLLQYVLASIIGQLAFGRESFNSCCDVVIHTPILLGVLGGIVVVAHLALWFATFYKRGEGSRHAAARLVVREGAWTFGLITIQTAGPLSYTLATRSGNPIALFVWPMVVTSIASCRMIIHMREVKADNLSQENRRNNNTSSIIFTTFIDTFFTIESGDNQMDQPMNEGEQGPVGDSS